MEADLRRINVEIREVEQGVALTTLRAKTTKEPLLITFMGNFPHKNLFGLSPLIEANDIVRLWESS